MQNNTSKLSRAQLKAKTAMTLLCAGLFFGISFPAQSHPETSTFGDEVERAKNIAEKRKLMRAKMESHRERPAQAREDAAERRREYKQKAALRTAKSQKERAKHTAFKTDLIEMLKNDRVIKSENYSVKVTYSDGHPIANGIALSAHFGDKYDALWRAYDLATSDRSSINILPGHYEYRDITDEVGSYHFVMQTNP